MSLRRRLTLWYLLLLGVSLVGFSLLLFVAMSRHLYEMTGEAAERQAAHVVETLGVANISTHMWMHTAHPDWRQIQALLEALESPDIYTEVMTPDGNLLYTGRPNHITVPTPEWALDLALSGETARFDAKLADGRFVRVVLRPLDGEPPLLLQVAADHAHAQRTLARLRTALVAGIAVIMLLAGAIGSSVAREALLPISKMVDTARAIALSKGFSRRIQGISRNDELGRLAATFNEMLASLEEAYNVQKRFVADASHELRTPLSIIQGNIELLRRPVVLTEAERAEILETIHGETQRMSRLIDDLLSLARADAGVEIRRAEVELDALVMEAARAGRIRARETHTVKVAALEPVKVTGDRDRLKQLLLILLDNALTYTPAGGSVTLGLRAEGNQAVLTVADTGIGIAPEDLPHIFERFYRADKARSRAQGGTGLGLAIARWIVEKHGGHIDVTSEPGRGSVFSVHLPLAGSIGTTRVSP